MATVEKPTSLAWFGHLTNSVGSSPDHICKYIMHLKTFEQQTVNNLKIYFIVHKI